MLDGLEHMHNVGKVAHLDMKLENILLDEDFNIKLCDFGFSDSVDTKIYRKKGTLNYMPPEIITNFKFGYFGTQADIFACGAILFILIFGVPAFNYATKDDPFYRFFVRGRPAFFYKMHPATKLQFANQQIDPDLVTLLNDLLECDPEKRPQSIS